MPGRQRRSPDQALARTELSGYAARVGYAGAVRAAKPLPLAEEHTQGRKRRQSANETRAAHRDAGTARSRKPVKSLYEVATRVSISSAYIFMTFSLPSNLSIAMGPLNPAANRMP